ncbi:MAG: hypothetical protein GXP44_00335 [bacterium]|nr:hypothetical protein [bacterium]
MGLLDKIEELQKKPESYRKRVLVVLMALIMSAIILVWVSTLNLSGGKEGQPFPPPAENKKTAAEYAPFGILKDATANIKNLFNEAVGKLKR